MKTIIIETESELKKFAKENRRKIRKINGVEFDEFYPILTISNQHAMYYDVESQGNKFLFAPFKIETE